MKESNTHCHAADATEKEIKSIINNAKEQAKNTPASTKAIVTAACATASSVAVVAALPPIRNITRTTQRKRKLEGYPPNPNTAKDLVIPEKLRKTNKPNDEDKENFILFDNGNVDKRIVIFATAKNLEFLKQCDGWHVDGTFNVAPSLFSQLFVIHGKFAF